MIERKDVYSAIDDERDYQDSLRKDVYNDTKEDSEKSLADFIIYIEYTLNRCKESSYFLKDRDVLSYMRKIAALAVACMETHGVVERDEKIIRDTMGK